MAARNCACCQVQLEDTHVASLCDACLLANTTQLTQQTQGGDGEHAADAGELCVYPGCNRGTDARFKLTGCLWCRKPYHIKCINADVYICDVCREMPQQITLMASTITTLSHTLNTVLEKSSTLTDTVMAQKSLMDTLSNKFDDASRSIKQHQIAEAGKATQQLDALRAENTNLRKQIAEMDQNSSAATWQQFSRAHGTLILGSSIVRDIDPDKLVSTKCVSVSGGKIRDALLHLDSLPRNESYERIVLVTAGNDCDQDESPVDVKGLVDQYRDLVKVAKSHANKVTISSICPRDRSAEISARISAMNGELLSLSKELSVDFADSTPGFYLSNGCLNDGYLLDGVHLNPAGTNYLVSKLELKIRPGLKSAHTNSRERRRISKEEKPPHQTAEQTKYDSESWGGSWQKVSHHRRKPSRANTQDNSKRPSHDKSAHSDTRFSSPPPHSHHGARTQHYPSPRQPRGQVRQAALHPDPPRMMRAHHPPRPTPLMDIDFSAQNEHQVPPTTMTRPDITHRTHEDMRCQLCSGRGHSADVCRSRVTTCYSCGTVGHYSRQCPNGHN